MFVVLREIHSSSGKEKNVKHESMELFKLLTAEGSCFSHFSLNVEKNSKALSLVEA